MMLLTNKELESYVSQENCRICKKQFEGKYVDNRIYCKVRDHCNYTGKYIGAPHNMCNLKYSIPKEVPDSFHFESNYYHYLS